MVGEVLMGLFCLALGWLCLSHALRYRRIGYTRLTRQGTAREGEGEKPRMIIPIVLGILFLGIGKAFLVLALVEMF